MRLKVLLWGLVALLLVATGVVGVYFDRRATARDPVSLARRLSDLSVPADARVIAAEDQWNEFNGDGHTYVELRLTAAQMAVLHQEALGEGYRPLPIPDTPDNAITAYLAPTARGLYRLKIDKHDARDYSLPDYSLAVLDESTGRLLVYLSIT